MNFTPGPWRKVINVGGHDVADYDVLAKDECILSVNTYASDLKIKEANVNLVVAAPELYSALTQMIQKEQLRMGMLADPRMTEWKKAIKKANGEL